MLIFYSKFEVTPFDAQALVYYLASRQANDNNLLHLTALSDFQQQQTDPNWDHLFENETCMEPGYNPPCPNGGSDASYLLRYIVNKYPWLDMGTDPSNVVEFTGNNNLKIKVKVLNLASKYENTPASDVNTNVYFELHSTLNQNMRWTTGTDQ